MTIAPPLKPFDFPPDADAALLALAARGDGAAAGRLVRRYLDFVYAAALRQTRDPHTAEDVTQTVFLLLSKKAGRVRPAALPAWLHQTTRYAAANANRARNRRRRHEQAAARPEGVIPYVLPEPDPLLPLLDDAIASLRSRDRRVVIGRYLRGEDMAHVARDLRVTTAAAQKRLERAVGKLRDYFGRRSGVRGGAVTTAAVAAALTAAAGTAHAAPPALATAVSGSAASSLAMPGTSGLAALVASWPLKIAIGGAAALLAGGVGYEVVQNRQAAVPAGAPPAHAVAVAAPAMDADRPYTVMLTSGVTVELLGIGENPSLNRPWWTPDGASRPAPYALCSGSVSNEAGRVPREVAYRVKDADPANPATLRLIVTGTSGTAGGSVMDNRGDAVEGVTGMAVIVPDRPTTVRFDIADGAWQTLLDAHANTGATMDNLAWNGGSTRIDPPRQVNDGVEIEVTQTDGMANENVDFRLLCLDADGKPTLAYAGGGESTSDRRRIRFGLHHAKAADVQTLRLQTRKFGNWIEFRDVAMSAGQQTHPTVATSEDGPVVGRLKDGAEVQMIAIGDAAADRWWTPRGRPTTRPMKNLSSPSALAVAGKKRLTVVTRNRIDGSNCLENDAAQRTVHSESVSEGDHTMSAVTLDLAPDSPTISFAWNIASEPELSASLTHSGQGAWDDRVKLAGADITMTLSNPRDVDGHATFDLSTQHAGDWPKDYARGARFIKADGTPMQTYSSRSAEGRGNEVYTCELPLAELKSASVTLTHYDHSIAFENVPTRPVLTRGATVKTRE